MSKIGNEYLRLQESGLLPDIEIHDPARNAWLETQDEADLEHQIKHDAEVKDGLKRTS